jgi:hypothetical protein
MQKYIHSLIFSLIILIIYLIYNKKPDQEYIIKKNIITYIIILSLSFIISYIYINRPSEIKNVIEKNINNAKVPF